MILNIARKELKSVFASPMGWIILALLMFSFGTYYLNGINDYFEVMSGAIRPAERSGVTQFVGQNVYGLASFIMLFAVPLLSMRLISEERRSQTLPFLFSAPLSLTEIVLGKFIGLVAFLSITIFKAKPIPILFSEKITNPLISLDYTAIGPIRKRVN